VLRELEINKQPIIIEVIPENFRRTPIEI